MAKSSFFITSLVVLVLTSCDDPIPIPVEVARPELVVVSNFTSNEAIQVTVTKTNPVLEGSNREFVLDASVKIYKGAVFSEHLVQKNINDGDFVYYTTERLRPEIGTTYTIEVEAPGFEPVTATSKIPEAISILGFELFDVAIQNLNTGETAIDYRVALTFEDPANEENYYHLNLFQQIYDFKVVELDTMITGSYLQVWAFDDFEDTGKTPHPLGGLLLHDGTFNGQRISFDFPVSITYDESDELLGKVFLELRSVTQDYHNYYIDISEQVSNANSPFKDPIIINDNIEGGSGIFAGYSSARDSVLINQ
ncbi:MAG TPA: DUF4249 domain-containing protein [Saprospiraceae bacterium]|nr:DUF4249 domain-containing protein [Saprospiraceae bacterium]HMQ82486.1 DUF4249 domain-containing protein [Saprospiraceae bacterium]